MTARPDGPLRPLTRRQQQIADGIGRGLTNKQIAAELAVSVGTVKSMIAAMALLFDGGDLPARQRIFLWVRYEQWLAAQPTDTRRTA